MSIKPPKKKSYVSTNSSLALDPHFKLLNFSPNHTSKSIIDNIKNFKDIIKYSKKYNQNQTQNYIQTDINQKQLLDYIETLPISNDIQYIPSSTTIYSPPRQQIIYSFK